MQKISIQRLPGNVLAFSSLSAAIHSLIETRRVSLPSLSGYPVGAHLIGRLQNSIKLGSLQDLMGSLTRLKRLSRLASEVLGNIPTAKVDKYQLLKQEVEGYVQKAAGEFGYIDISSEDTELVALLITASEANQSNWILDMPGDSGSNRFIQLQKLRESVLTIQNSGAFSSLPFYDPISDSMVTLGSSSLIARIKNKDDRAAALAAIGSVYCYGYLRVIDHVDALLNSTEMWPVFIFPRQESGSAKESEERTKSLRLFAAYLHALTSLPHFFSVILFYETVAKMSKLLTSSLIIPDHILRQYQDLVVGYDVLNVAGDVTNVMKLLGDRKIASLDTTVVGYFLEAVRFSRLDDDVVKASKAAVEAAFPVSISDLKLLNNNAFNALLTSHPVAEFDLTLSVDDAIVLHDEMQKRISEAISSINPGIGRYITPELAKRMKTLGFNLTGSLGYSIALSPDPMAFDEGTLEGGTFSRYMGGIHRSFDTKYTIRNDYYLTMFNGRKLVEQFPTPVLVHRDLGAKLRGILGFEYKSLYPSWLVEGDLYYDSASFKAGVDVRERIIETMTGMHIKYFEKTVGNTYSRRMFATAFSSFALLYVTPAAVGGLAAVSEMTEADLGAFKTHLVTGYGQPYGCTYEALEAKQGGLSKDELIMLAPGVYVRLLKVIPIPVNTPMVEEDFYAQHQHYYFSANSQQKEVTRWVVDDSCLQFCLVPTEDTSNVKNPLPTFLTDRKYAYLNDALFDQLDLTYRGPNVTAPLGSVSVSPKKHEWQYVRFKNFIDYTRVLSYAIGDSSAVPVAGEEQAMDQLTKMVKAAEDDLLKIEQDVKQAKHSPIDVAGPIKGHVSKLDQDSKRLNAKVNSGGGKKKKPFDKKGKESDKPDSVLDEMEEA